MNFTLGTSKCLCYNVDMQSDGAKKSFLITPLMWKIGVGVLIVAAVMLIATSIINSLGNQRVETAQIYYQRLVNLDNTLSKYRSGNYIKSAKLRQEVGNLDTSIKNTVRDMAIALPSIDVDPEKMDEKIVADEAAYIEIINIELEEAELNGTLDRVMARICLRELRLLVSMNSELSVNEPTDQIRDVVARANVDFNAYVLSFSDFVNSSTRSDSSTKSDVSAN